MPIQGIEKTTKDDLLTKVLNKQYSLEMEEAAERIKREKNIVRAFLRFTAEEDWQSLQKRFPHHGCACSKEGENSTGKLTIQELENRMTTNVLQMKAFDVSVLL